MQSSRLKLDFEMYLRGLKPNPYQVSSFDQDSDGEINHTNISAMIAPKSQNVVDLLRKREIGIRKNVSIENPFLKIKTKLDPNKYEDLISTFDELVSDVFMVKEGPRSLFGLWKNTDRDKEIVSEVFSTYKGPELTTFDQIKERGVVDFCSGFDQSGLLMSVSNDPINERCSIMVMNRLSHGERYRFKYYRLYCCCCNSFAKRFAIGTNDAVMTRDYTQDSYPTISAEGNIHSVYFNDTGTVLYCGNQNGDILAIDIREESTSYHEKLFEAGVNDMILLPNQREIICASFEGYLCKFDLRMKKESAVYLNHSCSEEKSPLSINESRNLLCATGLDNITRLWSLNGGVPVQVLQLPWPERMHRSCLRNETHKPCVYLFQKRMMFKSRIY